MYQSQHDGEGSEDGPEQQVVVVEKESERSVDVQDVLSECPPEVDRLTANPLRESYGLVLSSLQPQPYDIADLHVPTTKAVYLLKVLQAVQASDERSSQSMMSDLIVSAEKLGSEGGLSWEMFDTVMSKQAVRRSESNLRSGCLINVDRDLLQMCYRRSSGSLRLYREALCCELRRHE